MRRKVFLLRFRSVPSHGYPVEEAVKVAVINLRQGQLTTQLPIWKRM